MFNTPTLFILGAGASAPYGYPIGKKLIQDIIDDMEDSIFIPHYHSKETQFFWNENDVKHNLLYEFNDFKKNLYPVVASADDVEPHHIVQQSNDGFFKINFNPHNSPDKFLHSFPKVFFLTKIKNIDIFYNLKMALEDFDPISIDAFLRDNPTYADAGKIMILYSLLKREDPDKFHMNQCSDNWYSLLLNDLISECADNPEKLSGNKVKFITFNYDVSLDFYLQSRIKKIEIFIKTSEQLSSPADKFLEELDIKHVYGQLYSSVDINQYGAYFDFSDEIGESASSDDSIPSLGLIKNFKRFVYSFAHFDNIKTMYDERNDPTEKEEMVSLYRSLIQWANEIIFVGFGFDRDNLNMLSIPDRLHDYEQLFSGKTIRYLNYKGNMKSLVQEFEKIQEHCNELAFKQCKKKINIIQSNADSICSAYQNDFKKFLFR